MGKLFSLRPNPESVTEIALNVSQDTYTHLFGVYHIDSPNVK